MSSTIVMAPIRKNKIPEISLRWCDNDSKAASFCPGINIQTTHISTPIVLKDGEVYGTLCCFSFSPAENPDPNDLKRLQYTAQLTAGKIDKSRASKKRNDPPPDAWQLAH